MPDGDEEQRLKNMRRTTDAVLHSGDRQHRVSVHFDEDPLGLDAATGRALPGAGPYVVTIHATIDGTESVVGRYRVERDDAAVLLSAGPLLISFTGDESQRP